MTINLKHLIKSGIPKYLAISDAIETAIYCGDLLAGARLPTHRELADQLNVSVQTVSNAYAHAEKKGLVNAWVGSGTFVSNYQIEKEAEFMLIDDKDTEGRAIDLSIAHPVCTTQHKQLFNNALMKIAQSDTNVLIREARSIQGQKHHIEAAAEWLGIQKIPVEKDRILLCNGASQGLMLALATVTRQGDLVACEDLVDHGLIARSRILNFKLCGLPTDREGIIPEAFEIACQQNTIKALCCTPSMSNPSSSHMSLERRKAIADVARRYNVLIIEDDVYGALEPDRVPPLSSFLPDQAFYVTSLTKTVAPGLRVGFMVVPKHLLQHTISRMAAYSWMATPILFEVAALWIKDGTLKRLIEFEQKEFAIRQRLARELLAGFEYDCHPNGMHLWLSLPEGWGADELVATAQKANVLITGYQPFIVDQGLRLNRVRISLGVESSRYRFKYGLKLLADMLNSAPPPTHFLL
jgi:DNA-binding transcriptional MocR family regulator